MLFQVKLHNTTKITAHDFDELISNLKKTFNEWQFKGMDGLATIKDSEHYHISSRDPKVSGTLEITFDPTLNNVIELKIAKNRLSSWSMAALEEVVKFLESYRTTSDT